MPLDGHIIPVDEVACERRREMFALMTRSYENVRLPDFAADLAEKDWVIELTDPQTGRLCGFSTQMVFSVEVGGRTVFALFSGDTVVDEPYRRNNPLAGLWGRLVLRLAERMSGGDLFWFLISKGYKTYRFLPVFFREFFPQFDRPTPRPVCDVVDAFARRKFSDRYDAKAGIVRADADACRLRPGTADVTPRRMQDPHVQFFCERNPRHAAGDELCCLAPLGKENFTPAAWKVIGAAPELSPGILADIDATCERLLSQTPSPLTVQ